MLDRAALILCLSAVPAFAQQVKGNWEGTAYVGGGQPVSVAIDSTDKGWSGSANTATGEVLPFTAITVKSDTLSFSLNYNGSVIYISGLVSGKQFAGRLWMDNNEAGTIEMTRKEAAPAKPEFLDLPSQI